MRSSISVDSEHCSSRLSFSFDAFSTADSSNKLAGIIRVEGAVLPMNTREDFNKIDRKWIIRECAEKLKKYIETYEWINKPSSLNTFVFTVYADLKKYTYDYWNCIPALLYPRNPTLISQMKVTPDHLVALVNNYISINGNEPFLLVGTKPEAMSAIRDLKISDDFYIVFCDTSTKQFFPGWPLRNLLAAVAYTRSDWKSASFICHRSGPIPGIIAHIGWDNESDVLGRDVVGWERDVDGILKHSFADLSSCFDPVKLMEQSVELNLRLIRWRLVPDINLERFVKLKCLILGAGTLGCNIARVLLGWGVRNFTFVDNATISYNNIVRQSLFEFKDASGGCSRKAEVAAAALQKIHPLVNANGVCMKIPMPGHSVSVNDETVALNVEKLKKLIIDHDVVFLVLDSREARWLPTLIAAAHHKLAISVALGFDSFLIIRHGILGCDVELPESVTNLNKLTEIPGSLLGCYFCSDVTAPGNSSVDRTMDQQCTVSRAGMSFAASGMAVELLAALLQHPLIGGSPALTDINDDTTTPLGATPHQIRGFISKFTQMTPLVRRFERCIACGRAVISAYKSEGYDFLFKVFNQPKLLESISGLDQLQASATEMDMWEFDDNESITST